MTEVKEQLHSNYDSKDDNYYEWSRAELIEFIPESAKLVLDVGCGRGKFGATLKQERGCTVWGIEPHEASAKAAAKNLDKALHNTFSPTIPELQNKKFDAICFNDVLEHFVEPETVLKDAKQLLAPSGVIMASIPNILYFPVLQEILLNQDWKYEDAGTLDKTHLRFFTKKSIIRMFENCGFEVVRIEGINETVGRRYKLLNAVFGGFIKEWKYLQFAVQAKIKNNF